MSKSDDTISRQDAVSETDEWIQMATGNGTDMAIKDFLSFLKERIESLPSAEPKTGEWIQKDMCADRFCSECNYAVWDSEAEEYNFCPNCGADMRGEENEIN